LASVKKKPKTEALAMLGLVTATYQQKKAWKVWTPFC
jgi:hypothetical protein